MKINVGVIFGGRSVEHEVSIISAIQAMEHLDRDKYDIYPIYITKEGSWKYDKALNSIDMFKDMSLLNRYAKDVVLLNKNGKFYLQKTSFIKSNLCELDIILPVVHGTNVEDGTLQGYLETVGIPYVGSDVFAASVGQDKVFMKQIFESMGIPITKYVWFFNSEYDQDYEGIMKKIKKLKFPVFVKPAKLGSSVGISKVNKFEELDEAIIDAFRYDNKLIIEEGVSNLKEANISVLGNNEKQELSVIEEVLASKDFLTYQDKYEGNGKKGKFCSSKGMVSTTRKIPAELADIIKDEIETQALKSFKALNSSGVVRIDFLIDEKEQKVYVNEVNTIPGSLSFYLWEPTGKTYKTLLDDMINIAIKDYQRKRKITYSFDSNILSGYNGIKGIKGIKK